MKDWEVLYEDPRVLNELVELIPSASDSFSAILVPNHPEIIEAMGGIKTSPDSRTDFSDLTNKLKNEKVTEQEAMALAHETLCEKYNVLPFLILEFNYELRQNNTPEIEYVGPKANTVDSEPYATHIDPLHLVY